MNALLSFFGRRKNDRPASGGAVAQRLKDVDLYYQPSLVPQLEHDHVVLRQQFEALASCHRDGDHDRSLDALRTFTASLRVHLLKENLHLYVYLKHALNRDAESAALMHSMRREMQEIGRSLNHFVTSYTSTPWNQAVRDRFSSDIAQIGEILTRRIDDEERILYPLYMPPSRYEQD